MKSEQKLALLNYCGFERFVLNKALN